MKKLKVQLGKFLMIGSGTFLVLAILVLFYAPLVGILAVTADLVAMYLGAHWFVTAERQVEGNDEVKIRICSSCSAQRPTRFLEFEECRAYLVLRQERLIWGYLCRDCADKAYRTCTAANLLLGWWSLPGVIRNPVNLCLNHVHHRRAKAMSSVDSQAESAHVC